MRLALYIGRDVATDVRTGRAAQVLEVSAKILKTG